MVYYSVDINQRGTLILFLHGVFYGYIRLSKYQIALELLVGLQIDDISRLLLSGFYESAHLCLGFEDDKELNDPLLYLNASTTPLIKINAKELLLSMEDRYPLSLLQEDHAV